LQEVLKPARSITKTIEEQGGKATGFSCETSPFLEAESIHVRSPGEVIGPYGHRAAQLLALGPTIKQLYSF
jgi:hypothetical protein